jgi:hypothetical protein
MKVCCWEERKEIERESEGDQILREHDKNMFFF